MNERGEEANKISSRKIGKERIHHLYYYYYKWGEYDSVKTLASALFKILSCVVFNINNDTFTFENA